MNIGDDLRVSSCTDSSTEDIARSTIVTTPWREGGT